MIVSQLQGRLGNQLFQYALGRCLAHRHGVPLYLDSHLTSYALSPFQVTARLLKRRPKLKEVKEKGRFFDSSILEMPKNIYLSGYWQTEKYFKPIESIMRKEFQLKLPQKGKNLALAQEISECAAISIHIRRGDYVSDPVTNAHHGILTMDYYQRCIEETLKVEDAPHFYLFTDDPEWTKASFQLPHPMTVIDHNGDCAYEDLRLMSQCKHHIIANSSFSWWGAYLNPNPEKRVFAPKNWYRTVQAKDRVPASWTQS